MRHPSDDRSSEPTPLPPPLFGIGSVEPLPDSFAPELQRLDALLGETCADAVHGMPAGLVDRIHAASLADLPAPRVLPLVQTATTDRNRSIWGRLALAASVALVASVATWLVRTPAIDHSPGERRVAESISSFETVLASDWRASSDVANYRESVAHLIETSEVTTGALTGELGSLFPELGL